MANAHTPQSSEFSARRCASLFAQARSAAGEKRDRNHARCSASYDTMSKKPSRRQNGVADPFVRAFLSSAIFFILELDTPIDGFIYVSSEPLRDALQHIDAS
jgi:hypothetical protein